MTISEDTAEPILIREEDEGEAINLADIPEASGDKNQARSSGRGKRRRGDAREDSISAGSDSDVSFQFEAGPSNKRSKRNGHGTDAGTVEEDGGDGQDDKKKLGLNTSYEGFSIYGRILCLVVKRKGLRTQPGGSGPPLSSQQMLENWVSTQAAAEQVDDDEDNG